MILYAEGQGRKSSNPDVADGFRIAVCGRHNKFFQKADYPIISSKTPTQPTLCFSGEGYINTTGRQTNCLTVCKICKEDKV